MPLVQDEPKKTYNHYFTRHFIRRTCYGGKVGANLQEINSNLCFEIKTFLQIHLKSNSPDICNLMQDLKNYKFQ